MKKLLSILLVTTSLFTYAAEDNTWKISSPYAGYTVIGLDGDQAKKLYDDLKITERSFAYQVTIKEGRGMGGMNCFKEAELQPELHYIYYCYLMINSSTGEVYMGPQD